MHRQREGWEGWNASNAPNEIDLRLGRDSRRVIHDPPLALTLFSGTRFAWLWLIVRVLFGWELLSAGRDKLQDPAWMHRGNALQQSWQNAANQDSGWSGEVLQYLLRHEWYGWLAPTIAVTETLVGIGLLLGLFTGIAAFTGGLLTFTAVLAGSISTNPLLFATAVLLVAARKTAGWIGLDHCVLPILRSPRRTDQRSHPLEQSRQPANHQRDDPASGTWSSLTWQTLIAPNDQRLRMIPREGGTSPWQLMRV